jgi:thioredoxin
MSENQVIPMDKPLTVTDESFEEAVINYSKEMRVVVDFWAEWCGPCRMVAPILEKLAGEYAGRIRVAKVDTDANMGLSQAFQIMSIPTIMIVKEGHIIFGQPGALPEPVFRELFDKAIDLDIAKALADHAAAEAVEEEVDAVAEETVEAVAEAPVEVAAEAPAKSSKTKAEAKTKRPKKAKTAEPVLEEAATEAKPRKSRQKTKLS